MKQIRKQYLTSFKPMLASVLSIPHMVFVAVAYRKSCCGLENINEDLLSSYKMRGNSLFFVLSALQALTHTKLYEIGAMIRPI